MPTPTLRLATPADLGAINAIYNHYVLNSTCTYQTEPSTEAERAAWFALHTLAHPVTVLDQDGTILGWGALSRFHPRAAYSRTVENSIYISEACQRRGYGKLLLEDLILRARALKHRSIVALISADQIPSIALHRHFGFVEAGLLKEAGYKFDRWLDVLYMQLMLE